MIGSLCAQVVAFFLRKKVLFWGFFLAVIAVLGLGVSKLRINEDLYAIFPKGAEFKQFNEVIQRNSLNKQVVFSIHSSGDDWEDLERLELLKKRIDKRFKNQLSPLEIAKSVDQQTLISYLQRSAILHLSKVDYAHIENKLTPDSIRKKFERNAELIQGPNALFLGKIIAQDPLGLFNEQLAQANPTAAKGNYVVKDGVVYSHNEQTVFFFSSLTLNQKDTKELERFHRQLEAFKIKENKQNKELQFDYFGTFEIAVQNAVQVKTDTTLTSIISIAAILFILIFYYRSILAPLYFLLPGFFGILCGLGIVGFINPDISAISLATSSVLLGIVLDYSFHFYTHLKHAGSVLTTVKEIAAPMLIGSFTTVAALGALLFTNSIVLKNFGLIALCTLSGSVLFTLLILPVLINSFNIRIRDKERLINQFKLNNSFIRIAIILISILSLTFIFYSSEIQFDSDINNLSFHTSELKEKERFYTGVNPQTEKKLFVFANGKTAEEAKQTNELVYEHFVAKQKAYGISELVSLAPYLPSEQHIKKQTNQWQQFWKKHPDAINQIQTTAPEFGFNPQGFQPFYKLLSEISIQSEEGFKLAEELGISKFYSEDPKQHSILTTFTVEKAKQEQLKTTLKEIPGIYILDISEMAKSMLTVVQQDFNYLFLFSSLLVLISLLVIYGRIELSLFAFFPMVLAWIWISGITSLFDISFNFINIIVATFVFGLGDDFSIFTTDGLIQRTKTGVNSLKTYQAGILLSGLTTIIGTGVLYFAKHPAIHSIAVISVIGIGTILLITLLVQPTIYNFLVTRRIRKKRGPATFFITLYSFCLFGYFFIGSLILNIFLIFILIPLPIAKKHKRNCINYLISKLAKSTLYAGFHIKKEVIDAEKLNYNEPCILIANHSSFLDILAVLMLHPKTIIMVKKWVYYSPIFAPFIRYGGYLYSEEGAGANLEQIQNRINDGYSIVIFPEGTRSDDGQIKRFHKGAFYLSQALKLPVQPLLILGTHEVNPKNDYVINAGQIKVKALDRLYSLENENYRDFCKRVTQVMRKGMEEFRREHAGTAFYRRKVLENYLLKGPVIEWYVRVKWRMEAKNYDFYNQLIGDRKHIVDIGCGYGYLSLFLHYANSNRTIVGVDYDEEKVTVADNCIKLTDKLIFEQADIREWALPKSEVFMLHDVLHYLQPGEQTALLEKIVANLEPNGILLIRDGVTDLDERLKNTQLTEKLSTKWLKFNKTTNPLSFLAAKDIRDFAQKHGFQFELIEHSKKTSNVLMILRKKG